MEELGNKRILDLGGGISASLHKMYGLNGTKNYPHISGKILMPSSIIVVEYATPISFE